MPFWFRSILIVIWLCVSCFIGVFIAIFRWGNPDVDHTIARMVARFAIPLSGVRLEVEGQEHLTAHQPCLYVGNHQHSFDVITFGSIYPKRTIVIGKKELLWIPFFGIAFVAAGNILIDRKNRMRAFQSLQKAAEQLKKRNVSIFMYPEGTRNQKLEGLLPFKKGAFHLAIAGQVPIVPILCGSLGALPGWKEGHPQGSVLKFKVLPPIKTEGLQSKDVESLLATVRAQMEEALRGLNSTLP